MEAFYPAEPLPAGQLAAALPLVVQYRRIDAEGLYSPLVLWALQQWQKPGQALHLALDTTVLWNRFCVVALSVVCHGRAIPLLWQTLEHPSASVSAEVVITLLERTERLLAGFSAITVLADRAFPSAELLGWFEGQPRWHYVMRLRSDTWIHGTAAPMGCEVRRLRLPRGHCRGFRDVRLWECGHRSNLLLARPVGITAAEPWYLVSNLEPSLDPGLPESCSDHVSAGLNASQCQHSFDVVSQLPDALPN